MSTPIIWAVAIAAFVAVLVIEWRHEERQRKNPNKLKPAVDSGKR